MNALIEYFNEQRNFVLEELFKLGTSTEKKIDILRIIEKENILGYSSYIGDSPDSVYEILDGDHYRYEVIPFLNCCSEEDLTPELVDEIWEFVKENKVIGCTYDW